MRGIELLPAKQGGFMVMDTAGVHRDGYLREFLFAGTLDACLDFIRTHFNGDPLIAHAKKGQIGA